eukprot:s3382_g12.t1
MVLAQCVCPARGDDGEETKTPIQPTGWDELFFLLMLTSIAAIAFWEATRYLYRVGNRWMRRYRKAKKLVEVSQLASSVARQEIAGSSASRAAPTTPRVRRRAAGCKDTKVDTDHILRCRHLRRRILPALHLEQLFQEDGDCNVSESASFNKSLLPSEMPGEFKLIRSELTPGLLMVQGLALRSSEASRRRAINFL